MVVYITSKQLYAINFFFINFAFKRNEEGLVKEKLTPTAPVATHSPVNAEHNGKIVAPYLNLFVSYNRFCKRL